MVLISCSVITLVLLIDSSAKIRNLIGYSIRKLYYFYLIFILPYLYFVLFSYICTVEMKQSVEVLKDGHPCDLRQNRKKLSVKIVFY
jgi:hypothetical protein